MDLPVRKEYCVGPDVFPRLFDPIFEGTPFQCWRTESGEPQLRIHGGPGSGKTTFVGVVAKRLRDEGAAVATVFIQPEASWDLHTVEAVMLDGLRQLLPSAEVSSPEIREHAEVHEAAIRRLSQTAPVFFLVDGSDSNDIRYHRSLEHELSQLQRLGVRNRLPTRNPQDHEADDVRTSRAHSKEPPRMVHPYQHSLINMNKALTQNMNDFICWNLQAEHGSLWQSKSEKSNIPLSKLGFQLTQQGNTSLANKIAKDVTQYAGGNVALARLRLDIIHGLNDLALIEVQSGTPPPDVIALFDLAFDTTQLLSAPTAQRILATKAMAVVSQFPFIDGVAFETVRDILRVSDAHENGGDTTTVYTEDEVALSTKGLLVFSQHSERPIYAYNISFHTYLGGEHQPAAVRRVLVDLEKALERSGLKIVDGHLLSRETEAGPVI